MASESLHLYFAHRLGNRSRGTAQIDRGHRVAFSPKIGASVAAQDQVTAAHTVACAGSHCLTHNDIGTGQYRPQSSLAVPCTPMNPREPSSQAWHPRDRESRCRRRRANDHSRHRRPPPLRYRRHRLTCRRKRRLDPLLLACTHGQSGA